MLTLQECCSVHSGSVQSKPEIIKKGNHKKREIINPISLYITSDFAASCDVEQCGVYVCIGH